MQYSPRDISLHVARSHQRVAARKATDAIEDAMCAPDLETMRDHLDRANHARVAQFRYEARIAELEAERETR